jgi:hypothetical protein
MEIVNGILSGDLFRQLLLNLMEFVENTTPLLNPLPQGERKEKNNDWIDVPINAGFSTFAGVTYKNAVGEQDFIFAHVVISPILFPSHYSTSLPPRPDGSLRCTQGRLSAHHERLRRVRTGLVFSHPPTLTCLYWSYGMRTKRYPSPPYRGTGQA